MQRAVNRPFSQYGTASPGVLRPAHATQRQHGAAAILKSDTCLIVFVNKTREGLTVHCEAQTPHGSCFLDNMAVDLDIGGVASIFCCVGNDIHMDCSSGLHKLSLSAGELRFLPGVGFRQKMMGAGLQLPAKYVLHVEIEEVVESKHWMYLPLTDFLLRDDACKSASALATLAESLPSPCTLLVPRILPRILESLCHKSLLNHLTIPVALFFGESKGGVEKALDGASVVIRMLPNERVSFEIAASVHAPAVMLQSSLEPMRSAERFQIIYLCD